MHKIVFSSSSSSFSQIVFSLHEVLFIQSHAEAGYIDLFIQPYRFTSSHIQKRIHNLTKNEFIFIDRSKMKINFNIMHQMYRLAAAALSEIRKLISIKEI